MQNAVLRLYRQGLNLYLPLAAARWRRPTWLHGLAPWLAFEGMRLFLPFRVFLPTRTMLGIRLGSTVHAVMKGGSRAATTRRARVSGPTGAATGNGAAAAVVDEAADSSCKHRGCCSSAEGYRGSTCRSSESNMRILIRKYDGRGKEERSSRAGRHEVAGEWLRTSVRRLLFCSTHTTRRVFSRAMTWHENAKSFFLKGKVQCTSLQVREAPRHACVPSSRSSVGSIGGLSLRTHCNRVGSQVRASRPVCVYHRLCKPRYRRHVPGSIMFEGMHAAIESVA